MEVSRTLVFLLPEKLRKSQIKNLKEKMKLKRVVRDMIEYVFLLVGGWIGLKQEGSGVASHDGMILLVLLAAYGLVFFINFILQLIVSLKTKKVGKALFFLRLKIFTGLLLIPTLGISMVFAGDGIEAFLYTANISVIILIYYIFINLILSAKYFLPSDKGKLKE